MATLGRTLGPFGNARAAHEAADKAGLKLGMTVEELEVDMTRERKIRKGQRKDEILHFCLYEATISPTASRSADITGTVAAIACAALVALRQPIAAVQRGGFERRQSQRASRAARYRIVRHVHLFWGQQPHPERALRGTQGALRAPGGPAQGYRENIADPRQSKFQYETVSVKCCEVL